MGEPREGGARGRKGPVRRGGRRWAAGLTAGVLVAANGAMAQPVVQVAEGRLAGHEADGVSAFLGVPFAAPPVGANRWRAPAPAADWQGVRSAAQFAPSCSQGVAPGGFGPWTAEYVAQDPVAEDCLYLNVWAPAKRAGKRPVMVWIHGGAFMAGSGSVPIYEGAGLAAKDVVVVTVNYRLGALGFLAHPELTGEAGASGNYGLMDQVAALRWIKRNIAAFGGDPDQVTIAGQSAGALSVLALMEAPGARGLFSRAIAQSGAGLSMPTPPLAAVEPQGQAFATAAGARTLAELRALPVEKLLAASGPAPRFFPIRDGAVLPAKPGALADVPLITGLTADEGSAFNPRYGQATSAAFQAQARTQFGPAAERLLALYPTATDAQAGKAALTLARDKGVAATLLWLEARAAGSRAPAYAYIYDHPEPGPGADRFGAFHSSEIPYVFRTLDKAARPFVEQDRALAELMSTYWLNFVRHGDPNGAGVPTWAPYVAGGSDVMRLGERPGVQGLGSEKLKLFRVYSRGGGPLSVF